MATVQISAAANASKQNFVFESTADVAPTAASNAALVLLYKIIAPAAFNQQQFKGLLDKLVGYALTGNLLQEIEAGTYAAAEFVLLTSTRSGAITLTAVAAGAGNTLFTAAASDTVSLAIPVVNAWVANGSTVELTSFAKRAHEVFMEQYGKLN